MCWSNNYQWRCYRHQISFHRLFFLFFFAMKQIAQFTWHMYQCPVFLTLAVWTWRCLCQSSCFIDNNFSKFSEMSIVGSRHFSKSYCKWAQCELQHFSSLLSILLVNNPPYFLFCNFVCLIPPPLLIIGDNSLFRFIASYNKEQM